MLKSQKEENEQQLTLPIGDPAEYCLTKIDISVSNSLDNAVSSDEDMASEDNLKPKQTRRRLSNSVKDFLESIFLIRPSPNRRERELIAKKCGVTALQIRVWVRIN